jgi:hypothetical protein
MRKSVWETRELSAAIHSHSIRFASAESGSRARSDTVIGGSRHTDTAISMVKLKSKQPGERSEDLERGEDVKGRQLEGTAERQEVG